MQGHRKKVFAFYNNLYSSAYSLTDLNAIPKVDILYKEICESDLRIEQWMLETATEQIPEL